MTTASQEKYAFMHLSLIDLERVSKTIELLPSIQDSHVKEALIRDALISYAKPFSRNKGLLSPKLSLDENLVPPALIDSHKEIRALRDQLIAHNDLTWQKVEFGPGHSFSVTGYERIFIDDLMAPLRILSEEIHLRLMRSMREMERNGL